MRLKILLNNFSAGTPDVGSKSKLHQIMNYISNNAGEGSSVKSDRNLAEDASEYANQSRSSNHDNMSKQFPKYEEDKLNPDQKKLLEEKAKEMHSSTSIYDIEVQAYNRTDPRQEEEFMREEYQFDFYVDNYSDDKIKEIISIFRNDFKPPKNLWIENMNIQVNAEANYFNDVFADDDNYNNNDTEENINDSNSHNQEIDDIGYNISEVEKLKTPKVSAKKTIEDNKNKQESQKKAKDTNYAKNESKEEVKYNDRIKPIIEVSQDDSEPTPTKEFKDSSKHDKKSDKSKSDKQSSKNNKDATKVNKAKDGLNIEVNNEGLHDIGRNISKHKQSGSSKGGKKGSKSSKADSKNKTNDFNQTQKLPSNLLKEYEFDDVDNEDIIDYDNYNREETSRNKLTKEAEEQINRQLKMIQEEKAKQEYEKFNKKRNNEKKSSRSKNRQNVGQKSSRDGYSQYKKKRPHSHKKRGSASTMQELKKKMGWTNSQTSRGRTGGDKFLNYSLDEINQKLKQNYNTNISTNNPKGIKKRLNKSFENVFSACASTSRAKRHTGRSKKYKQKPISSSPRRATSREKNKNVSNHAKTPNTTSRKRLNGSLQNNAKNAAQYSNAKELTDRL